MLTVYKTPLDIIKGFDVDCCCVAFIAAEARVVATKRWWRSIMYGANICDSSFDGPNYCRRLEKYALRGFRIAVPGFEEHKVSRKVLDSNYVFHERNDLMLRIGPTMPLFHNGSPDVVGIGTHVRHFERLLVLAFAPQK